MSAGLPPTARTFAALLLILAAGAHSGFAQDVEHYKGQRLAAALRALQVAGLRIVFTSATVTPDMRVRTEPRAAAPRQQLEDLLAPHGLKARDGPGGIIEIVRAESARPERRPADVGTVEGLVLDAATAAPLADAVITMDGRRDASRTDAAGRFRLQNTVPGERIIRASSAGYSRMQLTVWVPSGRTTTVMLRLSAIPRTHSEHVIVSPTTAEREHGVPSTSLGPGELERVHGSMADDPIRIVHAFPRVAAVDDFRSDFTVRGSPFRHVDLVIDGVSTHSLQHAVYGRGPTGSLPMLGGQVLGRAVLRTGAYPRRYGDRLGPQLDLTLREGSREQFRLRGSIGGTNATIVSEGPLGSSKRGSWLVSVRQSYLEWPAGRSGSTRNAFGFSDAVAKAVYDVNARQQVAMSVVGGITSVDEEDDVAMDETGEATNRASLVNLSWRSTFGSATVLTQRAYLVKQQSLNSPQSGREVDRRTLGEAAYRAELIRRLPGGGLLEAGAQVGRTASGETAPEDCSSTGSRREAWMRAAYAHVAWRAAPSLTVSPGVRLTDSTLLSYPATSWWVLGEWSFKPGWSLNASGGVSHQLPGMQQKPDVRGPDSRPPERAVLFDVTLQRRLSDSLYGEVTLYRRFEADVLREADVHPRLVGGAIVPPDLHTPGVLQGSSRGIELIVQRQALAGFSGWAAYSYGKTRYTDPSRRDTFWADFDQRHALNLFGGYRFSDDTSIGATFRAGTNVPIPGYLVERDGGLYVGRQRNLVRLPAYARLDARGDRRFTSLGRRVTLFVEVLNLLNRRNAGPAAGHVDPETGEAIGFTDPLLRRRASAGAIVEF